MLHNQTVLIGKKNDGFTFTEVLDKGQKKKTISLCVYVLFINIIIIFSQDLI